MPVLNSDHISYEMADPQGSPSAALCSFSAHAETACPAAQSMEDQPLSLHYPHLMASPSVTGLMQSNVDE